MKEKFCTTCQMQKSETRGKYICRGSITRWLCEECNNRRSQSFIKRERVKLRQEKTYDLEKTVR